MEMEWNVRKIGHNPNLWKSVCVLSNQRVENLIQLISRNWSIEGKG